MKSRGKLWLTGLSCILTVVVAVTASSRAGAQDSEREFIYTANFGDDTIPGFSLNLGSGKATVVPGSPFSTGIGPVAMTHSPDGRFVYVVTNLELLGEPCGDGGNGQLISYSVNPHTGALTQLDEVVLSGLCSSGIAIDPTGKFVYASSFTSNLPKVGVIDGFRTSNGHVMPLPGSPFVSPIVAPDGQQPAIDHLAIPPDGKVLYGSNPNDSRGILIFDRDTTNGTLAFRTGFNTGSAFGPIAITPSGKFILALGAVEIGSGGPGIFEFEIGTHGNLTPVPGSPFHLPRDFGNSVAISPDGEFVAVVGQFSGISGKGITTFRENAHGKLSLVPGSPFGDANAAEITFNPSGRFVLIPGVVFRIHPETGAVTHVSDFPPGAGGEAITVLRTCVDSDDEDRDDKHEAGPKRDHDDRRDSICHERHGDRD